jgi:hypothetical protein
MTRRQAAVAAAIGITTIVAADVAHAEPVRILVAAGSRVGLAAERPLKYAPRDAERVRDVVVTLGGVRPGNAFVLEEPTRAALFQALENARIEASKHPQEEVTLFFYFSGHGDRDAIHLGDDRVLMTELSSRLNDVPAGLRIAVTDACRATRDKGFSADAPFSISASAIAGAQATGQVWLHASGEGEAAQESDELQGAIFTHSWLNGLRGAADTNSDSRVTLEESFAFAHSQTMIRSAKSSGVLQSPEAVVALREVAPLVLTATTTQMARLSLPALRDAHFLVYSSGSKSVVSSLWGASDRRMTLRVPPGRYVVQRRVGPIGSVATVAVGDGEERRLDDRDFASAPLDAIAQKGVEPDTLSVAPHDSDAHHEIAAGYAVGTSARTATVHGPFANWSYAWPHAALTLGAGVDVAGRVVAGQAEQLVGGYGRGGVEYRTSLGSVVLRAGAGGRAGVVLQSLDRANSAPTEHRRAFVWGPEIVVAGRVAIDRRKVFALDVGVSGNVLFLKEEVTLIGVPGASAHAALLATF